MRLAKSPARTLIEGLLQNCGVNQLLSYEEMASATGLSAAKCAAVACTAVNRLTKKYGLAFICEKRMGYRRVTNEKALKRSKCDLDSSRRKALLGMKRLKGSVNLDEMPPAEATKALAMEAKLGVVYLFGSRKGTAALERVVASPKRIPNQTEVLELFKKVSK